MRLYLDTSVLVPLHVREPTTVSVEELLASQSTASISDLAVAEFSSALSGRVRIRSITAEQAANVLEAFQRVTLNTTSSINIISADIRQAGRLAGLITPTLRVPDAVHIAVCLRLGLTLVTSDRDQIAAARFHGVEIIEPARS